MILILRGRAFSLAARGFFLASSRVSGLRSSGCSQRDPCPPGRWRAPPSPLADAARQLSMHRGDTRRKSIKKKEQGESPATVSGGPTINGASNFTDSSSGGPWRGTTMAGGGPRTLGRDLSTTRLALRGWIGTARQPTDLTKDKEAGSLKNVIVLARKRPIQEGIIEKLDFSRIFGNYVTGQLEADSSIWTRATRTSRPAIARGSSRTTSEFLHSRNCSAHRSSKWQSMEQ